MNIIDPHLHLFDLRKGHYHWLKPDQLPNWPDKHLIHRYFSESDLSLSSPLQLAGFVHIEAGFDNIQPWREIDWLESHCKLPFRSVAFADICAKDFYQTLDKLIRRRSLCGVRYILDKQADALLANELVQQNLQLLAYRQLSFDAQFSITDSNAVGHLCDLLGRTPQLKVIINHGGWPPNTKDTQLWNSWLRNLSQLSHYHNVAIKLSGWEMENRQWQVPDIVPVLNATMDIMGEPRVMLASNFPLCTWRSSYQKVWMDYVQTLPPNEEQVKQLCYLNAAHWYRVTIK